jgi:hypothetical protein
VTPKKEFIAQFKDYTVGGAAKAKESAPEK